MLHSGRVARMAPLLWYQDVSGMTVRIGLFPESTRERVSVEKEKMVSVSVSLPPYGRRNCYGKAQGCHTYSSRWEACN